MAGVGLAAVVRLQSWLREQRRRGRSYQPRFRRRQLSVTWLGALLSLALLGLLSAWSGMALLAAPLGASSVLLFGYPASPLAQPRNIVLGNLVGRCSAWWRWPGWARGRW